MDSSPASHMRRRTNSFACTETLPLLQTKTPSVPHVDSSDNVTQKPSRFRRSSFALSGEKPTFMDVLVDSASQQLASVAAHREAKTINTLAGIPSGVKSPTSSSCGSSSPAVVSKRVSNATLVPNFIGLSSSDSAGESDASRQIICPKPDPAHPFIWYNSEAFPSNPLSSDLVQKYLAAIALDKKPTSPPRFRKTSALSTVVIEGNIPGFLPFQEPPIASMTMAAHHGRDRKISCTSRTVCSKDPADLRSGALTDHASVWSDTESWAGMHNRGYIADAPASLKARYLLSVEQRMESELRARRISEGRRPDKGSDLSKDPSSKFRPIPSPPKFDVSRVYEGLPSPHSQTAEMTRSTTSLDSELLHSGWTPPSTPNSVCSNRETVSSRHGMQRLRAFLDHLTPNLGEDDGGKYIYMDENTRARRAKAHASNIISPVSF